MALEYVFLNMAANTSLTFNDAYELDYFFETFCIDKAKKKIQNININKDFKKFLKKKELLISRDMVNLVRYVQYVLIKRRRQYASGVNIFFVLGV